MDKFAIGDFISLADTSIFGGELGINSLGFGSARLTTKAGVEACLAAVLKLTGQPFINFHFPIIFLHSIARATNSPKFTLKILRICQIHLYITRHTHI